MPSRCANSCWFARAIAASYAIAASDDTAHNGRCAANAMPFGMATAKGIAFAAQRPLWAVSSLAAIAYDAAIALANQQLFAHLDGIVVAVLDARRGEVFAGCYRAHVLAGRDLGDPAAA